MIVAKQINNEWHIVDKETNEIMTNRIHIDWTDRRRNHFNSKLSEKEATEIAKVLNDVIEEYKKKEKKK